MGSEEIGKSAFKIDDKTVQLAFDYLERYDGDLKAFLLMLRDRFDEEKIVWRR